ncbi:PID-CTERM protein-sorting domain-containing protein [Hymenobacter fastidiosus]|uniref:PID-CTERM protein-sorting domain-containing protein n=1 Tax=Hymenobacter fastidiosus TaxID=486264 RepID=UPI0031E51DB7
MRNQLLLPQFIQQCRRVVVLASFCLGAAGLARAQGPGNGGPAAVNVPIDGGVSLLLAAGAAYGLRRLRRLRRR